MPLLQDILIWGGAIMGWLAILVVIFTSRPWFLDYSFTVEGIYFVGMGGRIVFGRIARQNIRKVEVVPLLDYSHASRFAAVCLPNRFVRCVLLVQTDTLPRYWLFTPTNADRAKRDLAAD